MELRLTEKGKAVVDGDNTSYGPAIQGFLKEAQKKTDSLKGYKKTIEVAIRHGLIMKT